MKLPTSPKGISKLILRVSFGGALALVGIAHYMMLEGLSTMISGNLGVLEPLGSLWVYILPALQIVGGVLIVLNYRPDIAAWAAGIALGSIIIGMLLKVVVGGTPLGEMMPTVNNTLLWLLIYVFVVKCCLSCEKCETSGGGMQ